MSSTADVTVVSDAVPIRTILADEVNCFDGVGPFMWCEAEAFLIIFHCKKNYLVS